MRDSQRARLYSAEQQVRQSFKWAEQGGSTVQVAGSTLTLPVERKFASIESIQMYADRVLNLNWVQKNWPKKSGKKVTVRERRGQTKAHYEFATNTIAIPPHQRGQAWAMRELVVLHELAHHLAPESGHGPKFVSTFQDLVEGIIGSEAGFLLRVACLDSGVQAG